MWFSVRRQTKASEMPGEKTEKLGKKPPYKTNANDWNPEIFHM